MVSIGDRAPSFTLPDQDGNYVSLASLAGQWVVLYFYPRDDTPGCTVEACEFTASLPNFSTRNAVVFGCSADGSAAHQKFIKKHNLGIRLLTDADKSVMNTYGAWGKKVMYGKEVEGVIRSTVLIDPQGNVAHHWPKVSAAGHAAEVGKKLAELLGETTAAPAAADKKASKPAAKKAAKPAAKKPAAKPAAKAPAAKKPAAKKAAAKPAAKPKKKAAKKAAKKSGK
jgi:peroxiredoxin Q/BCP